MLHNKEFEVLRDTWHAMYEAYWHARQLTSRHQYRHDFTDMGDAQALEFIASTDLRDWEKAELATLADGEARNEYYGLAKKYIDLSRCRKLSRECLNDVEIGSIYISIDIRDIFLKLHSIMSDALVEFDMYIPHHTEREVRKFDRADRLQVEGYDLMTTLEAKIRARLWEPITPSATT